jgi:hypothetical protein
MKEILQAHSIAEHGLKIRCKFKGNEVIVSRFG